MILQSVEAILLRVAFGSIGATMRDVGGHTLLLAPDVIRLVGCAHATTRKPAPKTKKAESDPLVGPKRVCHGAFQLVFPKMVVQPLPHSAAGVAGIKHKSLVEQANRAD